MSDGPSGNTLVVVGATIVAFLGALATLITACANFVTAWFSRRNGKRSPEEWADAVVRALERERDGEPERRERDVPTRHRRRVDDHVDE